MHDVPYERYAFDKDPDHGADLYFVILRYISKAPLHFGYVLICLFLITDSLDADVVSDYLKANALIFPETEGRIKFVNSTTEEPTTRTTPTTTTTEATTPPKRPDATLFPIIFHKCPDAGTNAASRFSTNLKVLLLYTLLLTRSF